jgi:hypothetical protein
MSDETPRLEVSVNASWTAEIPADIDPENDLYSDGEMEERLAEEIGLSQREEVVEWEVNCQSEVTTDE